jgi:hypothetical protein
MRFGIIANPRSGSTALAEAIKYASGLKYLAEPFNKDAHIWCDIFYEGQTLMEKFDPVFNCDYDYFKTVSYYDGYTPSDSSFLVNCCSGELPTLYLYRNDPFHCTLSTIIADKLKIWNIQEKNQCLDYEDKIRAINIEDSQFKYHLDCVIELNNRFLMHIFNHSDLLNPFIYYEDLFIGDISDWTYRKIELFTGPIDREKFMLELNNHKMNGPEIYSLISNYNELKEKYDTN